jgi:hypothetical protein
MPALRIAAARRGARRRSGAGFARTEPGNPAAQQWEGRESKHLRLDERSGEIGSH